jgi:gluconate 5-dehydrogenase
MAADYLTATFGLEGRTALITGAASGLGYAIACSLGSAGARIVVNDLSDAICAEAVEKLSMQGIAACGAPFDVSDAHSVNDAVARLGQDGWKPDILVSNAGNQNRMPVIDQAPEAWQSLFDVHVNGAFNCVRAVLPNMLEKGDGRIILMCSVAALASMPGISAYSAAKGALAAFTRSLAVEYGGKGITSNALAPGFVRTKFTVALQERDQFNDFLQDSVPLGRWAQPEDIAPAVVYLASRAGSFVNGHVLAIDGGLLAQM